MEISSYGWPSTSGGEPLRIRTGAGPWPPLPTCGALDSATSSPLMRFSEDNTAGYEYRFHNKPSPSRFFEDDDSRGMCLEST